MKRQFVHIQPSQGNQPSIQPPAAIEQAEEIFPQRPPAHPEASPSSAPGPSGKGLLSSWKAANAPYGQPHLNMGQQRSATDPFVNPSTNSFTQRAPQPGTMFPQQPAQQQQWAGAAQMPGPPKFGPGAPIISQATPQAPMRMPGQSGPLMPQGIQVPGMSSSQFSSNDPFAGRPHQTGNLGGGWGQNNAAYFNNGGGSSAVVTPPMQLPLQTPQPPNGRIPRGNERKKRRFPIWGRVLLGFLVFLVVLGTGAYAYYQANYATAINNITGKTAIRVGNTTSQSGNKTGDDTNQSNATDNSNNVLTGNRINILLLGSDNDGKFDGSSILAQTDIIVTVDPTTKYVGMLSIPRDLQVTETYGVTAPKLDEVFSWGYQKAKANAPISDKIATAAGHTMDVIEYNYGIHIDHYAWVGLDGFVKVIDTAGGVDIDALHPMVDDTYPDDVNNNTGDHFAFKRLYIAPGPQHMDGPQALEYVRTRHSDLVGDFGRSARQQQILNQLKLKLATPAVIGKTGDLLKDLNGAVQTDLSVNQIIQIANLARQIDSNKIDRVTLSPPDYSYAGLTHGNFGPKCPAVRDAINKMFGMQNAKCLPQADTGTSGVADSTGPAQQSTQATMAMVSNNDDNNSLAQVSSSSILQPNESFSAIHSILDLMFMPVFETFEAGKV